MPDSHPRRSSGIAGGGKVLTDALNLLKTLASQSGSFEEAANSFRESAESFQQSSGAQGRSRMPGSSMRSGSFNLPNGAQGVYGFSFRGLGDDQSPSVSEFGNVKMTNEGAVVSDVREPLVDVFDEGEEILVVFELPGVADGDAQVELNGDVLALSARGQRHRFESETLLPAAVQAESGRSDHANGYLQIRYTKLTQPVGDKTQEETD
ncbi:MAG: Hsp20/alpha crystallin family protein [Candidatus Nanopelagicales bacterium]